MALLGAFASISDAVVDPTRRSLRHLVLAASLPIALPRQTLAPISVSVSGTVRTPPGTTPPPLRQIEIAINRNGHLETAGLPICHPAQIEGTTSAGALRACRDALVGTRHLLPLRPPFPNRTPSPSQGHILAFNSLKRRTPGDPRPRLCPPAPLPPPASSPSTSSISIGASGTELNGFLSSFSPLPLPRLRQAHRPHPAPHLHLSWPPP